MITAIAADEFAATMARLSPFEKNPIIAIGVSGGADSMALLYLLHSWAQGQGGHVVAITVDHNIRSESANEAVQVGAWCAQLGVEHIVLKWDNPDAALPGLQNRARTARHELLANAAAARGILHLAIAHHEDDQAETVLLRLAKGSGPDGLAGMSAIRHKSQTRLLRPLLGFPRERLVATCQDRGQGWIEDPSNRSPQFARPRLRAVSDALAAEGLTAHHLALTAAACGRTRAALERATAAYLGHNARIMPQGYAEFVLADTDNEIRRRALAQLVQTIGGGDYQANADALDEVLRQADRTTLGNCLIEPFGNRLRIMREDRNIEPAQTLAPGQTLQWGRFQVLTNDACEIGALGTNLPPDITTSLPMAVVVTQPAFYRNGLLIAAPTLKYYVDPTLKNRCKVWFSVKMAAGSADFAIV